MDVLHEYCELVRVAAVDGLDLITGKSRSQAIEHAMLIGFGFGGVNASLILQRFDG